MNLKQVTHAELVTDRSYLVLFNDDCWRVCTLDAGNQFEFGQGKYYGDSLPVNQAKSVFVLPTESPSNAPKPSESVDYEHTATKTLRTGS